MRWHDRAIVIACIWVAWSAAASQAQQLGVGRPPTSEEIRRLAITIPPSGKGLPAGQGTAKDGARIYETQCARCHGASGKEGPEEALTGGAATLATAKPLKSIGSYWPYATTLWDHVNRAMPFDRPGTLPPSDVYAVVARVLEMNGIVAATDVIDATTLPAVRMPNRDGFYRDDRPDVGVPKAPGTSSARSDR